MSSVSDIADLMVHDVAKYVCRAAQNWNPSLIEVLHPMLVADIFEGPIKLRFEQLRDELPPTWADHATLQSCAAFFTQLDDLRPRIEEREATACEDAVAIALNINKKLRLFKEQTVD